MKKSILTKLQNAAREAEQNQADQNKRVQGETGRGGAEQGEGASDAKVAPRRAAKGSPVVGSASRALSELAADTVINLDPKKLHPSPFRDRLEDDAETLEELSSLQASIEAEGQKIPVLVRPHPDKPGEYQLAYGHRRLKAVRAQVQASDQPERIFIRAHVRDLTDGQLIREQSLENGVRENLSWIEKALWAVQLKKAGLRQREMTPVLGASEADVSRYFKVTGGLPVDVVYKIGRAKEAGRPKWMKLLSLYHHSDRVKDDIDRFLASPEFADLLPSQRLDAVIKMGSHQAKHGGEPGKSSPSTTRTHLPSARDYTLGGQSICSVVDEKDGVKALRIPGEQRAFAEWLEGQIEAFYRAFSERSAGGSPEVLSEVLSGVSSGVPTDAPIAPISSPQTQEDDM